jgi:hypothetical protein
MGLDSPEALESGSALAADLEPILRALAEPARSVLEMPRRIELCRQALALLPCAQNPPLWAALQNELANSLAQTPAGDRAQNIEQAIGAYQQALEVMTRQAMPVEWAETMMNLANAYNNRHGSKP